MACIIPGIGEWFKLLESTLRRIFFPALIGRTEPGDIEHELLSLPAGHGGLGVVSPVEVADSEFEVPQHLTSTLVCFLLQQTPNAHTSSSSYPVQWSKSQIMKEKNAN